MYLQEDIYMNEKHKAPVVENLSAHLSMMQDQKYFEYLFQ
jgi:hypothetical protein